jgi:hypothetical protein
VQKNIVIIVLDKFYVVPSLFLLDKIQQDPNLDCSVEVWMNVELKSRIPNLYVSVLMNYIHKRKNVTLEFFSNSNLIGYKYLTNTAWGKFNALSKSRPDNPNLLFLDSDVLLLPGWQDIWKRCKDLNFEFGAVKYLGHKDFVESFPGKNGNYYYFNSGVLLLKSNWWFQQNFNSHWIELAKLSAKLDFKRLDQDLFNYLIRDNYSELDKKYNQSPNEFSPATKILHFAGAAKPWGSFKLISVSRNFGQETFRQSYLAYKRDYVIFCKKFLQNFPLTGMFIFTSHWIRFTVMNLKNWKRHLTKTLHI